MKNVLNLFGVGLLILIIFLESCKKEEVPTLTTVTLTSITAFTAISGGIITNEGSGTILTRGVCWGKNNTPTIADNKTSDGAGAGVFTSNITGLNGGSTYFVRAFATNSAGTSYGMTMSFVTLGEAPTPISKAATNLSTTGATLNGEINANYLSTVVTFEYGSTTNYGNSIIIAQSPINGNTSTNVSANISGLEARTLYHFRIKGVNSLGTTSGDDMIFTTLGQVPTVVTQTATGIKVGTAILNGVVNPNSLSTTITFEYGTTITYGSSIEYSLNPISGNFSKIINANISGLISGTTYHFRLKATNSLGTTLGNDLSFTTTYNIKDIDGNIYQTVTIVNQIWMAENLKSTKYNNGVPITTDLSNNDFNNNTSGAYSVYLNNNTNNNVYGKLYNWYAVVNVNKLCPTGWHVPTYGDWTTLANNLNGADVAGGELKETGNLHWMTPNTGATNSSGFTALPGGILDGSDFYGYYSLGSSGVWWSSTEVNFTSAKDVSLSSFGTILDSGPLAYGGPKRLGLSVRCLKD